jgi:hypothetical protein
MQSSAVNIRAQALADVYRHRQKTVTILANAGKFHLSIGSTKAIITPESSANFPARFGLAGDKSATWQDS